MRQAGLGLVECPVVCPLLGRFRLFSRSFRRRNSVLTWYFLFFFLAFPPSPFPNRVWPCVRLRNKRRWHAAVHHLTRCHLVTGPDGIPTPHLPLRFDARAVKLFFESPSPSVKVLLARLLALFQTFHYKRPRQRTGGLPPHLLSHVPPPYPVFSSPLPSSEDKSGMGPVLVLSARTRPNSSVRTSKW